VPERASKGPVPSEESNDRAAVGNLPPEGGIESMGERHLADVLRLERIVFGDPWPESAFREELARERHGGYSRVLVEHGSVRAYSVAWFVADEAHLANLATDPEHRSRGLARALLRDLLVEARRRGLVTVWLEVRVGNAAAIRLYEGHGFRGVGIRKGYYQKEREDALVMVLPLQTEEGQGGMGDDGGRTGGEAQD
jgi:[ribosomal protein S18]-alanine N-acetyltransferase